MKVTAEWNRSCKCKNQSDGGGGGGVTKTFIFKIWNTDKKIIFVAKKSGTVETVPTVPSAAPLYCPLNRGASK